MQTNYLDRARFDDLNKTGGARRTSPLDNVGIGGLLWRLVHHGVGIDDAVAVCPALRAEDLQDVVVVLAVGPVMLEFEHGGDRRHGYPVQSGPSSGYFILPADRAH